MPCALLRRLAGAMLLAGASTVVNAQPGSTAAILLELPAGTRALALGDAFVAAGRDEAAIFYNPARLAPLRSVAAGFSVQQYLVASTLGAVAAAAPVGPGTIGIGVQVLDYGSEPELTADPTGQGGMPTGGTVSASDYAASLAYAVRWRRLGFGAAAKWVSQRLAGLSAGAGAVDVGASLELGRMTLGASLRNVGGDLDLGGVSAPLPRAVRLGASLPLLERGAWGLLGTAELVRPRGADAQPAGGMEVAWRPAVGGLTVLGRVGALPRPSGSLMAPLSFGGGVRVGRVAVDYAHQSFDGFGATHRFGARWSR